MTRPADKGVRIPWEERPRVDGSWDVKEGAHESLQIRGRVEGASGVASLLCNGWFLGYSTIINGGFRFILQRAVNRLSEDDEFQVVTESGVVPHASGDASWSVKPPFAASGDRCRDVVAEVRKGKRLTKKGTLVTGVMSRKVKDQYHASYQQLMDWFEDAFGYPVLVTHGTLLGIFRDGDLIPHDDDFDCTYISSCTNPSDVAEERLDIMTRMRDAGFSFALGVTGHIKVKKNELTIDLMPGWIEDGELHISSYTVISDAETFLEPYRKLDWEGRTVLTFSDPGGFLRGQYGPEWVSPDPGYRPVLSERGKRNRRKLVPTGVQAEKFGGGSVKKEMKKKGRAGK